MLAGGPQGTYDALLTCSASPDRAVFSTEYAAEFHRGVETASCGAHPCRRASRRSSATCRCQRNAVHDGVRGSPVTAGDADACWCATARAASASWARARRIKASCRWALRRERPCRLKILLMCDKLTPHVVVCRSPYNDRWECAGQVPSATTPRCIAYALCATGHSPLHLPVSASAVLHALGRRRR